VGKAAFGRLFLLKQQHPANRKADKRKIGIPLTDYSSSSASQK
jgi:hypothetical protein